MTANKPMTGEQLDELMTVAVNMQRDSEKQGDRPTAMFAYAVQVAVLEQRKVRNDAAALAAENAGLKAAASCLVSEYMMNKGTDSEFIACITPSKKTIGTGGVWDMWRHLEMVLGKTPATDAFLAEVRASARNEGINYAASRLAAAYNHGFIGKSMSEVADVVHMILDTKEELETSTLPAADGLSGEYAEAFLEDSAAQLRKGVHS